MSSRTSARRVCEQCQRDITELKVKVASIEAKLEILVKDRNTAGALVNRLIKYVVFPLIVVVGALVGVKLAF
jgi:hypothetical protein